MAEVPLWRLDGLQKLMADLKIYSYPVEHIAAVQTNNP